MNITLLRKTTVILFATTTVLAIGCSGGGSGGSEPIVADTVVNRIRTAVGDGNQEGWACLDQAGEASVYTFYDVGSVEGLEQLRLGSEYSVRTTIAPFHYTWNVIDNTSITLQSPPLGLQDTWTNIEFSEDNSEEKNMRAISGAKGQLLCSLKRERV